MLPEPAGWEDDPKENVGADAWVEFPPVVPEEKGLLNPPEEAEAPPDPKLKLKPPALPVLSPEPDWAFEEAAPKMGAGVGVELLLFPNRLEPELLPVVPAVPKLNRGGAVEVSVPRPNCFLAGDASSCFIGLPENRLDVAAGGDFGAPNRDLAAA